MMWEEYLSLQWCLNHWDELLTHEEYLSYQSDKLDKEIDNYFY